MNDLSKELKKWKKLVRKNLLAALIHPKKASPIFHPRFLCRVNGLATIGNRSLVEDTHIVIEPSSLVIHTFRVMKPLSMIIDTYRVVEPPNLIINTFRAIKHLIKIIH